MGYITSFINNGGPVMYIILFMFAIGLSILIERAIYLFKVKIDAHKFMNEVFGYLKSNNLLEAKKFCNSHQDNLLPKVIGAGLSAESVSKAELKDAFDEAAITEIPKLLKRTHYLPLIANVSTLLGLLGTIFGLMQSFISVASADPSQKASLLANGISIAMNTTALGLIVAIPCMIGHSYITSATQNIIHEVDMYTTKFINYLAKKNNAGTI